MTVCVDCIAEGVTTKRPIVSGVRKPRCSTHDRVHRQQAKARNHSRMVERTYSITGEQYELLYAAQGGRCAICQVATGKVKRLAVEHDHVTGEVYGLACGPCNIMLGRLGRTIDPYIRVINYLNDPPARRTLGPTYVPGDQAVGSSVDSTTGSTGSTTSTASVSATSATSAASATSDSSAAGSSTG